MNLLGLRAAPHWLAEAKYLWYCLMFVVAAGWFALRPGMPEPAIRLTGLVLQILNIGTVAWGISDIRALYGHRPYYVILVSWLRRFPLVKRSLQATGTPAGVSATAATGRAFGIAGTPADATLEQRVEALEKNLAQIHARITATAQDIDRKMKEITEKVSTESQHRLSEDEALAKKLELTATGGVHITAMGAVWLFVGVSLSTASTELAQWLQ